MATEKKFVGNVKEIQTQYGEIIKIGFTEEHLKMLLAEVKNGWVNVNILNSQKGGRYAVIDDFVPKAGAGNGGNGGGQSAPKGVSQPPIATPQNNDDDLPF